MELAATLVLMLLALQLLLIVFEIRESYCCSRAFAQAKVSAYLFEVAIELWLGFVPIEAIQ